MLRLNVNIDHVATVRNARGGFEPDPVEAAMIAERAGAEGIVAHLREDRRHIKDADLRRLKEIVTTKLDLEMGANEEIIQIALKTIPELVTIVPENRMELTTEGGLNVSGDIDRFTKLVDRMHEKAIKVSFFIEPEMKQIDAVLASGGDMVEFHTGIYANAINQVDMDSEFLKVKSSSKYAHKNGLLIAAGHGLNYQNTKLISSISEINELSIGHSIISRAVFVGLEQAIMEMLELMN